MIWQHGMMGKIISAKTVDTSQAHYNSNEFQFMLISYRSFRTWSMVISVSVLRVSVGNIVRETWTNVPAGRASMVAVATTKLMDSTACVLLVSLGDAVR